MSRLSCPFCGVEGDGEYAIMLHVEEHHTEDSPFAVNESPSMLQIDARNGTRDHDPREDDPWIECTRAGCGEYILISDIDEHLAYHEMACLSSGYGTPDATVDRLQGDGAVTTPKSSQQKSRFEVEYSQFDSLSGAHRHRGEQTHGETENENKDSARQRFRNQKPPPNSCGSSIQGHSLLQYISGRSYKVPQQRPRKLEEPRNPGRLGKRELGPHAFEDAMPAAVRYRLLHDAESVYTNKIGTNGRLVRENVIKNETAGLISVLADLCALDPNNDVSYLCHPSVRHINKIRCEGNFCGYWNIQMMLTYLQPRSPRPVPNIVQIQDVIEQAWNNNICAFGRIETGGIRGTRKWIGTNEALAYLRQIDAAIEALVFKDEENGLSAVTSLLDYVEAYFMSGVDGATVRKSSSITSLGPIYFQRFGHSMTIIGLERGRDGLRTLLVFDPSLATAEPMRRLVAGRKASAEPGTLLDAYRRDERSLKKWNEFEILVPERTTKD